MVTLKVFVRRLLGSVHLYTTGVWGTPKSVQMTIEGVVGSKMSVMIKNLLYLYAGKLLVLVDVTVGANYGVEYYRPANGA